MKYVLPLLLNLRFPASSPNRYRRTRGRRSRSSGLTAPERTADHSARFARLNRAYPLVKHTVQRRIATDQKVGDSTPSRRTGGNALSHRRAPKPKPPARRSEAHVAVKVADAAGRRGTIERTWAAAAVGRLARSKHY